MTEYRQLVRTADPAYLGECELAMSPIDICHRHEQQQIVMRLVELRLAREAVVGGTIELEVPNVLGERARPFIDSRRNGALLLSRERGKVSNFDLWS